MRAAALLVCSGVLFVPCLFPRSARAEGVSPPGAGEGAPAPSLENPAPPASKFVFSLGTGGMFALSDISEQRGDVVATTGAGLFGLNASVLYRVAGPWTLGLRGSWGSDLGARGSETSSGEQVDYLRTLWRVAAEGRYEPEERRGWYAALRVGTGIIVDSAGSASLTQKGPMGAAALGYDLWLTGAFSLGLELEGSLLRLPKQQAGAAADVEQSTYVYGLSSWLGLGVVGSLGI
jgi:hypothetical protein